MSILKPFPFLEIETWKSGTLFFFFFNYKKNSSSSREKNTHKIVRMKFEHKNTPQITLKSHNNF